MNRILQATVVVIGCSFAANVYAAGITDISAASKRGNVYSAKKAECKREAKAKRFGVHLIERNRWINDCIAGHKS